MRVAEVVALRSTCSRLQVGAVITDGEMKNILAIGYNGNYAHGPNECDTDIPGSCGCVHGELNALLKLRSPGECVLFCTDSPCESCSKAIVNAGIAAVYYRRPYRETSGLKVLDTAGVLIKQITA